MKLYAQHGHQPSNKIDFGLEKDFIQGVIYSPRFQKPDQLAQKIEENRNKKRDADIYIDPEFYASIHSGNPNAQFRHLEEWPHFNPQRRRDLVTGKAIDTILKQCYETTYKYDVTGYLAPNIYISSSLDSMEAGISMNFITQTKKAFSDNGPGKSVYATLAIDHRALRDQNDLPLFLNEITAIDDPPDGYYIVVGYGAIDERTNLLHTEIVSPEVIGGWMFLNYVFSINGYKIINGYSDILSPLLAACGGSAGATGWWTNLRMFSMGRYIKPGAAGGRRPNVKYLSKRLLNRISLEERRAYAEFVPEVINNLSLDRDYDADSPLDQTKETLQTWETITSLIGDISGSDTEEMISKLESVINEAIKTYTNLSRYGLSEGFEINTGYLKSLQDGINVFKELAEF